jgi:cellobiose-specific phosphotransferase system component IIA
LQKKFAPTFDAEDLTKLPNYQTIASVMINNVPSAAFSMSLVPQMGNSSIQLVDALKKLSSAKYGRPRALVDREIYTRLGAGDAAKKVKLEALKKAQEDRLNAARPTVASSPGGSSSFLDDWLAKRQQIPAAKPAESPVVVSEPTKADKVDDTKFTVSRESHKPTIEIQKDSSIVEQKKDQNQQDERLHIHSDNGGNDEVSVHLR